MKMIAIPTELTLLNWGQKQKNLEELCGTDKVLLLFKNVNLVFRNPHSKNVFIEIWSNFLAERLLNIKITSSRYNKGRRGNLFSLKKNANTITEGTEEGSFVIGN